MTNPAERINQPESERPPYLVLSPYYKDPATDALYVHRDLDQRVAPWEEEAHISPVQADEQFGDVESWVTYIKDRGAVGAGSFLTWNNKGLKAVLDYHQGAAVAGRAQWLASAPFVLTPEFTAWSQFATGRGWPLQAAVEFIEDHTPDIYEPAIGELVPLLRSLRSNVTAKAETTLREDGTNDVRFERTSTVQSTAGANNVSLPPEITIQIPVLRGHVDQGAVVRYKLVLKLRASVGDNAQLALRLTMPQQETVLEQVYAERVKAAKDLLGDEFTLLRAAG